MTKTTAQLINADSGKTNYYTPLYIINAASAAMGRFKDPTIFHGYNFDLDPASDILGNDFIGAWRYFDEHLNGLNQSWVAETVWLNHPYSRAGNPLWIKKAIEEYEKGNAKQICMITWASTSEKWFQPLFAYPMCFLNKRVPFIDPDRNLNGATKSSVVTYMGKNTNRFNDVFSNLGHVVKPYSSGDVSTFVEYAREAGIGGVELDTKFQEGADKAICSAMGIAEEAGEVLGLHKKFLFFDHQIQRERIREELGDVLWYVGETGATWGFSLQDIANSNIEKVRKRYPKGFDKERSKHG